MARLRAGLQVDCKYCLDIVFLIYISKSLPYSYHSIYRVTSACSRVESFPTMRDPGWNQVVKSRGQYLYSLSLLALKAFEKKIILLYNVSWPYPSFLPFTKRKSKNMALCFTFELLLIRHFLIKLPKIP